ncbi:acyl-CoA dehydrogenase family protein [Azomonas macrocytogenes]|uniref:Alkylation response protein AidB-like acyl-CoA dehydrogenase n=1 Tax=Azomonas macrocytogenes TaxID=69962 RepID=A0A839SZR3_AZOMA|nr:acyl-CoA dehydrogenase family protein [Azomonas macrocytogenes]MBB3102199.1 alkylation response protein AidB-like acyl-CoA dehydrogenase [Azomonas macrocytogenes]
MPAEIPLLEPRLFPYDFGHLAQPVEQLAQALAATAVERDRQGGSAQAQRELIRDSGLLTLAIPQRYDGQELSWPAIYRIIRYLAAVDSSLAHLFAFQHLQVATILLNGSEQQQRDWLTRTVRERWFWGNAANGRDNRLTMTERGTGYELDGSKSFCSGALGADALIVSAPYGQDRLFLLLPTQRAGLTINDDWDGFGQRQTDSGTVHFNKVVIERDELLSAGAGSPRSTLRVCLSQLILTQLYLGNAQGALDASRRYVREQGHAWPAAGVASAGEDPFLHKRYGELWLLYRGALQLAEHAAGFLQQVWERPQTSAEERGEAALLAVEARVSSARAALEITSQIFEAMGARATASRYGFDRFWRNVRVHSLHDPLDYKVRDLGNWVVNGIAPTVTPYS